MERRDNSGEQGCSPDAYLVAVRVAICGFADTVVERLPRLRMDSAPRRSFGQRVEVVHEQGDHGMPGMLRLEFDVSVAVLRHRPDALGVARLERLSIAEELVKPGDGALEIADGDSARADPVAGLAGHRLTVVDHVVPYACNVKM